jgi:hypothetical protein
MGIFFFFFHADSVQRVVRRHIVLSQALSALAATADGEEEDVTVSEYCIPLDLVPS